MTINTSSSKFNSEQISIVEKKYDATYVCETPIKDVNGNWVNFPCAIFYTEEPHPDGSNYFALYDYALPDGTSRLYICNGISAVTTITGVVADDGEIIYSRYRHDYRTSTDGSVFVDGGRDYLKCPLDAKTVDFTIINGKLKEVANANSKA